MSLHVAGSFLTGIFLIWIADSRIDLKSHPKASVYFSSNYYFIFSTVHITYSFRPSYHRPLLLFAAIIVVFLIFRAMSLYSLQTRTLLLLGLWDLST